MDTLDKQQILNGLVRVGSKWVTFEEKEKLDKEWEKEVMAGRVFFRGVWLSIEEKFNLVHPPEQKTSFEPSAPAQQVSSPSVVDNRVYNINVDNRVTNNKSETHQHLHVDEETLGDRGFLGKDEVPGIRPGQNRGLVDPAKKIEPGAVQKITGKIPPKQLPK